MERSSEGERARDVETAGRVDVALAVPVRGDRVLVARRRDDAHQGGLWEFPGGQVARDEAPIDAARRELREETGLEAERLEPLTMLVHDYVDRPLRFHVFLAPDPVGEPAIDGGRPHAWHTTDELGRLAMPPANAAIVRALRWRVGPAPRPPAGDGR